MLNTYKSIITIEGISVSLHTKQYEYPRSILELHYDVGRGMKQFYIKVGYVNGVLTGTCKHDIAKVCKKILKEEWRIVFN